MLDAFAAAGPTLGALASIGLAAVASAHVILTKRDVRAAIGWVGLLWLVPLVGAALYAIFGINRIARKAARLRGDMARYLLSAATEAEQDAPLPDLALLTGKVCSRPLVAGNAVEPLVDGDGAYPAMLAAIDAATESVSFLTYIFDAGEAGQRFVDALVRAHARGVQVRVLVDAAGVRYSRKPIRQLLAPHGVPFASFLPLTVPWLAPYANLRNHRKILVVDGRTGFTGGINIRDDHLLAKTPRYPTRDLHFRLAGPIVGQLQEVFAEDWQFTTGETLKGTTWFPVLTPAGDVLARGIADGPDEDIDVLPRVLAGAIACARHHVRIVTPYFLPDSSLLAALQTAALRGVAVDVLIPEKPNIAPVGWAVRATLPQLLEAGVRVWWSPPPFDHSKLMVVDDSWSLIGSTNWDARSLRLNFEMNVECYDADLAAALSAVIAARIGAARAVSLGELHDAPLWMRLRDGIANLGSPYL